MENRVIHLSNLIRKHEADILTLSAGVEAVVEIKFSLQDRYMVEKYLEGFPLRANKNSKYVIGIDHLF